VRTADVACDILLETNVKVAMPGDNLTAYMRLGSPLPIGEGNIRFFF
jgi:translation elongation factor EF-Tu-like GTPase